MYIFYINFFKNLFDKKISNFNPDLYIFLYSAQGTPQIQEKSGLLRKLNPVELDVQ